MGAVAVRKLVSLIVVALALLSCLPARAEQCAIGCGRGRVLCAMQGHTALAACLRGCGTADSRCRASCLTASRAGRAACRASGADCMTACPNSAPDSMPCIAACGAPARTCFADALASGASCIEKCKAGGGASVQTCLQRCAAAIGDSRSTCLASFQGCAGGCQGQATGGCFSTLAMECTAEPCGPEHPCTQPNAFCSERCATPPQGGTCLDPATMQCTEQTCSATQPCAKSDQPCVPVCPPPLPQGKCFDPQTKECTDQPCDPTRPCAAANQICTLQCPQRTPIAPCSSAPCGGPCGISPTCPLGVACPQAAFVVRVGQCTSDAAGNCACVPASPPPTATPQPTPTPQCIAIPCGGSCSVVVRFPCPSGKVCNGPNAPVEEGQCTLSADGSCVCVPIQPTPRATPTPGATGTPQCGGPVCGGECTVSVDCPPGIRCREFPNRIGQCTADATGNCVCMPVELPTATAQPTRTPQCNALPCGGRCSVIVPFPCPPGRVCNGPDLPSVEGQCALAEDGRCDCIPVRPTPRGTVTPRPTATPQCADPVCGGRCVISPICPPGGPCPEYPSRVGQCAAAADGSCQCVPVEPKTPTPECANDADCHDDDGCTADRCVNGACEHECLCVSASGDRSCCPGPAAFCAAPCGSDAAGVCGGVCPTGARCESASSANGACGCVSGPGGPCGGNIFAPPPVCAAGLVCHQTLPDVTGYCEKADCVPLFTTGCSQTADCCEPCENGTHAPCGVCSDGTCKGVP